MRAEHIRHLLMMEDVTLSGDPNGVAPYLQELFKGLGTGNELWSGVMTQYCQGVATGATSCPASNTQHVAYPTGGALAGVWVDESAASPSAATPAQLGTEAVKAASHFGNTTAAANRNAQYDIVSPHGANPDNYKTGGFCAWHDWNGDVGVTSTVGDIAFTNMPYTVDVGSSCRVNFINAGSAGTLDTVIGWTDVGAARTLKPAARINLNSTAQFAQGTAFLESAANIPITFSTTVSGATGNPVYAVYITLESVPCN